MSVKGAYAAKRNGEFFENLINASCIHYSKQGIAYIQKTPEPMRPVRALNRNRGQYMAVYEKKAQPDFTGTLTGGTSVIFEAKHTESPRIEFNRIGSQQELDLEAHHKLGAITFVLLSFSAKDFYRVPYSEWISLKESIGKKSLNQTDLEPYRIINQGRLIPFLDGLLEE